MGNDDANVTRGPDRPRKSLRKALSLSLVQTAVGAILSFGAVIVVSHILTPAEIGVFSVAAGLVALIQMLRDFGVTEFLIQETTLDEAKIRTVFTVNLIIAWVLAAATFAASGALGGFYGDPGVTSVLRVLSIVFVLLPFGAIPQTLMRRDLEFGKVLKIQLAQSVTHSCTTVGLAYAGFTYMSMAWSSLAASVVMVAGCAVWGWQYRVRGLGLGYWRDVLHFGTNRTVADIASEIGRQSANLVVGRVLGLAAAGLYSRGYGVYNMFRSNVGGAIGAVAFPAFAREHRDTGKAPELFLKSLVYLTGVSWPFFAAGVLLAYPIIRILFGNQWGAAVPLMRWLCAAGIISTLTWQCNQFLVALGRVRTVTRIEVEYQVVRVVITVAAAFYSLVAVAAVQVVVYTVEAALYYRTLREYHALSLGRCARALRPSVAVTIATCIVPATVALWPGLVTNHMIPAFCVAVAGGCVGWLLMVVAVKHPLLGELKGAAAKFVPAASPFMERLG